jgi:hypothetical protein
MEQGYHALIARSAAMSRSHLPAAEALGIVQYAKLGSGRSSVELEGLFACSNCHPAKRGIVMTKTAMLVIVLGITVGFVLWAFAPEIKGRSTARNISIQELHALATKRGYGPAI